MEPIVVNYILSGALGVAVWFIKRTLNSYDEKFKEQDKRLNEIQRDYLHRDDFKEFKLELRSMFDEIKADIREIKSR